MKIGKYAPSQIRKAIEGGIGIGILLVNSAVAELTDYLPPAWVVSINLVVGVATGVRIFLTKNAPLIDSADAL